MSNLRLLSDTTASSTTSVSVTDVFSADYDIYKIVTNQAGISSETSIEGRFINSSGSVVTSSNYDHARENLRSWAAFDDSSQTNQDYFRSFGEASTQGAYSVSWVYNPFDSTKYTFISIQNVAGVSSGEFGMDCIAVLKVKTSITGINFFPDNGNAMTSFSCQIYGLRRY